MVRPSIAHEASDEAFGEACVLCQGYTPECINAGACQHDGRCFTNSGQGFRLARKALVALIDQQPDVYARTWLRCGLDAIEHRQFIERGAMDLFRYLEIQKKIREAYTNESTALTPSRHRASMRR